MIRNENDLRSLGFWLSHGEYEKCEPDRTSPQDKSSRNATALVDRFVHFHHQVFE